MNLISKTPTSKEDAYLKNFLLFATGVVVFLALLASMSSFLLGRLRLSSSTATGIAKHRYRRCQAPSSSSCP
ncbi:unnamed protein product [Linum trigynum]|uniref:Uncharacterized protein n=1 Tax=Linum trigynum TaxID=586398 RepID=A0AAV2CYU5_9ROSI